MDRAWPVLEAVFRVYESSGFVISGAVAFAIILSLFPFCIFLGALSGFFGSRELASKGVAALFDVLPKSVAEGLAPQVEKIMTESRTGLLTGSGLLALFFATSANETLRSALNTAYRVAETRPYLLCLLISGLFVLVGAFVMLIAAWILVVGPNLVHLGRVPLVGRAGWLSKILRYLVAALLFTGFLIALHLWLAAGQRTLDDIWPGIVLSLVLMLLLAGFYARYLKFSDYTEFYAGLAQVMVAMVFFQAVAIIIILGAELNRGVLELSGTL